MQVNSNKSGEKRGMNMNSHWWRLDAPRSRPKTVRCLKQQVQLVGAVSYLVHGLEPPAHVVVEEDLCGGWSSWMMTIGLDLAGFWFKCRGALGRCIDRLRLGRYRLCEWRVPECGIWRRVFWDRRLCCGDEISSVLSTSYLVCLEVKDKQGWYQNTHSHKPKTIPSSREMALMNCSMLDHALEDCASQFLAHSRIKKWTG